MAESCDWRVRLLLYKASQSPLTGDVRELSAPAAAKHDPERAQTSRGERSCLKAAIGSPASILEAFYLLDQDEQLGEVVELSPDVGDRQHPEWFGGAVPWG